MRANEIPENIPELVELTNFIIESRDATMFDMKNMLMKSAEYVIFLTEHAKITGKYDFSVSLFL